MEGEYTMPQSFQELLAVNWVEGRFMCIGLDPDMNKLAPEEKDPDVLILVAGSFLLQVIDATAHLAAAFKPNVAFYEEYGVAGLSLLRGICRYIKKKYPHIVLIIDAKRGDVKNTSLHSANFVFDVLQGDAVTVSPYMGLEDALEPYVEWADKGVFVLARTSNKGAARYQDRTVLCDDMVPRPVHQMVAQDVQNIWNTRDNCGLVAGATAPEQLAGIRKIAPNLPLLVPGVGKQGGDLEKSVRAARFQSSNGGFLINSSSGILHPGQGTFPDNSIAAALELDNNIRSILDAMMV